MASATKEIKDKVRETDHLRQGKEVTSELSPEGREGGSFVGRWDSGYEDLEAGKGLVHWGPEKGSSVAGTG